MVSFLKNKYSQEDVLKKEIECGLSLVEFGVERARRGCSNFLIKGKQLNR